MTRELEDNILRSQLADTSPRTLVAPEHVFAGMLLVVVIATVFVVW